MKNITPYEGLYNKAPSFEHLRIFGCLCYAHNQQRIGDKFASRSRRCVFVGYPHGKKGWRLYDLEKKEIFVSRDVVFSVSKFPYSPVILSSLNEDEASKEQLWAPIAEGLITEEPFIYRVGPPTSTNSDIGLTNQTVQPTIVSSTSEKRNRVQ